MVSISEFLSGFSYHGEPVIQSGTIDPTRRREGLQEIGTFGLGGGSKLNLATMADRGLAPPLTGFGGESNFGVQEPADPTQQGFGMQDGQLRLDPNDFVFGGPEIFARLLQSAELDGGFLSNVSQNQQFGAETQGIMGLLGTAGRERQRGAAQANLNPIFAQRQGQQDQFGALSQILGRRAQLGSELDERQFAAQQAFANMLAQTVTSEKQFKVNTQAALAGAQIGAEGAIAGGKAAGKGAAMGGAFQLIGGLAGI